MGSIVDSEPHYCCVVIGVFPISSTVPSAPILTVTVTSTTITIIGSVPRISAETGFVVEWQRDTSVGCPDVIQDTMSVTGPFTSYTVTGLVSGNSYLITVRVYNFLGSAPTSTVSAMTEEAGERQKERERGGGGGICRGGERCSVCERERGAERGREITIFLHSSHWLSEVNQEWYCDTKEHHSPLGRGGLS